MRGKIISSDQIRRGNNSFDILKKLKSPECLVLFALRDVGLYELLLFLNIFKQIELKYSCKIYLGIPSKYESIKILYSSGGNRIYIMRNIDSVLAYRNKFNYIFDIKNQFIQSNNGGDLLGDLSDWFFGERIEFDEFISLNISGVSLYSDNIGICLKTDVGQKNINLPSSFYEEIRKEVEDCGLTISKFEDPLFFNLFRSSNYLINKFSKPSNATINPQGLSSYNLLDLIKILGGYKVFITVENKISLLYQMISGSDRCIILSREGRYKKLFPFLNNIVDINCLDEVGFISTFIQDIYNREFESSQP